MDYNSLSKEGVRLSIGLFGLKKADVDTGIQKLKEEGIRRIEQIEREVLELRKQKLLLSQKKEGLDGEIATKAYSDDFLEYCSKKSPFYINLFGQEAGREISEVTAIAEKVLVLYDEKINVFQNSINETRQMLEELLLLVANKNKGIEERLIEFMEFEGAYKFLQQADSEQGGVNEAVVEADMDSGYSGGIDDYKAPEVETDPESTEEAINETETGLRSPAITTEINNIRSIYLLGKIVGADIKNPNGELVVAKSTAITADVIDKVEKIGKLPELIVNMILPGDVML